MRLPWTLVAVKTECDGENIAYNSAEQIQYVEECAETCKGKSAMFAFGTSDYGTSRCEGGGCYCLCETAAREDGTCNQVTHEGYRLYTYRNPG